MTNTSPPTPKRDGFSLVELLVVIAIIAALLGILLPSLAGARYQSKIANCASNLKQTGTMMTEYATANRFTYPPIGDRYDVYQGTWVMFDNRASNSTPGFQNLGKLVETAHVTYDSETMYCPLQSSEFFVNSNGLDGQKNNIKSAGMALTVSQQQKYHYLNMRSGWTRRVVSESSNASTVTMAQVTPGIAFLFDILDRPEFIESSHADSLNVLYGDIHVDLVAVDPTEPPIVTISGLSSGNNPKLLEVWETQLDKVSHDSTP